MACFVQVEIVEDDKSKKEDMVTPIWNSEGLCCIRRHNKTLDLSRTHSGTFNNAEKYKEVLNESFHSESWDI